MNEKELKQIKDVLLMQVHIIDEGIKKCNIIQRAALKIQRKKVVKLVEIVEREL